MKNILSKIYSGVKVVAVILVIVASLGVIYNLFNDSIEEPIMKNTLVAESTYDGTVVDSVNLNNVESTTQDYNNDYLSNKIIYNSSLSLSTSNFDNTLNRVNNIIDEYNITVLNDNYRIYDRERYETFYLRVKSSQLDEVTDKLKELGNVVLFNKSAANVSQEYIDIEKRIESLNTQLERYYSLLENSDSTTNLSSIYSEIDYLENQIEYAKKSLSNIDEDVDYSSINLTITDTHKYNDDGSVINENFVDDLIYSFGDSFVNFVNVMMFVAIAIVYMIPFVILIGIILIIVRVIKKRKIDIK